MGFAESGFAQFMSSPAGRIMRVVVGLLIVGWGYTLLAQAAGLILVVVGLVPLAAGAFDVCVISGLLGGPLAGAAIRQARRRH